MLFSRTAVHGIYAICFLDRQEAGTVTSASKVAAALGITQTHALKILKPLAAAGVVTSVRGRRGGYLLTKTMAEVLVVDILDALNPSVNESRLRAKSCRLGLAKLCSAHRGLLVLEERMRSSLANETLAALAGSVCTEQEALADNVVQDKHQQTVLLQCPIPADPLAVAEIPKTDSRIVCSSTCRSS